MCNIHYICQTASTVTEANPVSDEQNLAIDESLVSQIDQIEKEVHTSTIKNVQEANVDKIKVEIRSTIKDIGNEL